MIGPWFYYLYLGLIIIYAIIPVPILRFAEHRIYKTHYVTFIKGYSAWFATNIISFLIFWITAFLADKFNSRLIYNEVELIFIFAIAFLILFPQIFSVFFRKMFNRKQIIKITSFHLLFFFFIAFTIYGLQEMLRYHDRYAGSVYESSSQVEKEKILSSISKASKITFPKNTKLIFAQWTKSDIAFDAKIEINIDDLDALQQQINSTYKEKKEIMNINDFHWFGPKHLGNPYKTKKFKIWRCDPLDILFNFDNNNKIIIYLMYATI